ncbi:Transcription initiation factor IIA subunit 2 [Mycena venus]|uniref:Transcription initiation factor IIA subunit 2 n=1 Tax=Mycena venus TaxID=2733690 RepID=A0A8H6XHG5_9AGAR|nr:Transcription initiation factor IIA subunit 2 [Mycena venus]
MASTYYEIYRGSTLGLALMDTIDELVRLQVLTGPQGMLVVEKFDRAVANALATQVKAKTSVKAHLRTYNDCEEVWTFHLRDATFKMDDSTVVTTPRIKVVACKDTSAAGPAQTQTSPKKSKR